MPFSATMDRPVSFKFAGLKKVLPKNLKALRELCSYIVAETHQVPRARLHAVRKNSGIHALAFFRVRILLIRLHNVCAGKTVEANPVIIQQYCEFIVLVDMRLVRL